MWDIGAVPGRLNFRVYKSWTFDFHWLINEFISLEERGIACAPLPGNFARKKRFVILDGDQGMGSGA